MYGKGKGKGEVSYIKGASCSIVQHENKRQKADIFFNMRNFIKAIEKKRSYIFPWVRERFYD